MAVSQPDMQVWSAAQSASPPKQAMVAAQQPALSLMHVLQASSSKARPALPRHVAAFVVVVVVLEPVVSGAGSSLPVAVDEAQATTAQSAATESPERARKRMGRLRSEPRAPARRLDSPWIMVAR